MKNDDELVQISCDPVCGFTVISHKRDEVKEIAMHHAEKMHDMEMTDEEAEKSIKPAAMMA